MPEPMFREQDFPLKLSLYLNMPTFSYDLEELILITKHRYNLLKVISESSGEYSSKWIEAVVDKLTPDQVGFLFSLVRNDVVESEVEDLMTRDRVSHYCLRLACARYYESLKWFIRQEVKLARLRWHYLTLPDRQLFLSAYSIHPHQVSEEEKKELRKALNSDDLLSSDTYRVHYSHVSELLRTRSVLLHKGWTYLNHEDLIFPVATYFHKYLNFSLRTAKKRYDFAVYDKRFTPFFRRISDDIRITFFKFSPLSFGSVKISELSKLSKESFPLCMEMLHYNLQKDKHLRNGGRFQYNLFLKGIGLSLVDAIKFWMDVFTKKISLNAFKRGYLYHIRHGYGKLGKNADYPPLSCSKILESTPGPVDHHGCPFNIPHREIIAANLARHSVPQQGVEDIWRLVEEGRPQFACARLFEVKHGTSNQPPTDHPNAYYVHSRNLLTQPHQPSQGISAADTSAKCISKKCCSEGLDW